ncbi:MAG: SDR family NAD(P)-dependent oxidoreductase, partial [Phocaeicola sp.]
MKNKIVLITGASAGIGEACARKFAKEGARIIVNARNVDKLQSLK